VGGRKEFLVIRGRNIGADVGGRREDGIESLGVEGIEGTNMEEEFVSLDEGRGVEGG